MEEERYCKICDNCKYQSLNDMKDPCFTCNGTGDLFEPKEGYVVKNKNGSMKADGGKTRFELLPWDLIEEIAQVMTKGAEKYSTYNWQGLPRSRLVGASFRHIVASVLGEELDKEWNLPHLAHAICELLYLRWMEKNGVDNPED